MEGRTSIIEVAGDQDRRTYLNVAVAACLWLVAYAHLSDFADMVVGMLGLGHASPLGEAVHFFSYDTPKILLLLVASVFCLGVVQTYFTAARTRSLLSGRRSGVGNALAASLGVVTPFCSCSAVPLFIGFVSAGIPLGVTFSFLVAAPMVNEVALVLLFGMLGWKIALLYLILGLSVAFVSGIVIGRLRMESHLEEWVRQIAAADTVDGSVASATFAHRLTAGKDNVRKVVGKIWLYVVFGIAAGACIHGYVPAELMATIMGKDAFWSVPVAVLLGIPMYSSAAGIIPVVEALIGKGAAIGTVLAFMMSVIALSAPELLILRKVMKPRLIATFTAVVATGILIVGYLFNLLLR
jgi:uncharacterized membrane protein YraQ (UPF0718 family)